MADGESGRGGEAFERWASERLGEVVSEHVVRRAVDDANGVGIDHFLNEVYLDVEVLEPGSIVVLCAGGDRDSALAIAVDGGWSCRVES